MSETHSPGELQGKVALVTGGATGIGAGVVRELAARGADIAFTHMRHDPAEVVAAVENAGRRAVSGRVDATDPAAIEEFVADAASRLGSIDIVVNNAGGLVARHTLEETTPEHWARVVELNLTSVFLTTRACLPHIPDGGRVVSISSLAGHNGGGPGAFAYASAKAGVHGLTRALAKELAPRAITVNAVAPGFILETPFHEEFTPAQAQSAAIAGTPIGRAGTPADVAAAVGYLASPASGFITGVLLDVNGGSYFS